IKNALATLGWANVSLLEGQASWGGSQYPPNEGWAVFRVVIQLGCDQNIEPSAADMAVATINFFKPSRSLLDALVFALSPVLDVGPTPSDAVTLGGIVSYQLDVSPGPSDAALSIAISLFPSSTRMGLLRHSIRATTCIAASLTGSTSRRSPIQ